MRSTGGGGADKRAEKPKRPREESGGTAHAPRTERQTPTARTQNTGPKAVDTDISKLMEKVLQRENVMAAYRRVVANGGASGVDGMTVEELMPFCQKHWARIREELLSGTYRPQPIRKVEIPKPDGKGVRTLGIPTVLDRMIQQALLQVLTPIVDPTFADESFGFRPGRSALQAVERAREYVAEGYRWAVDLDLEKFFDRVNHDVLMALLARRIKDKRALLLIRRYLQAGMMEGGLVSPRTEGTPQGGPLSPCLSNILLDELDKELKHRGHKFVRYADDCNVYVRSKAAGERVMTSLESFLGKKLRLKVNREKSAVARPWERKFLGYSVTMERKPRLRVAPQSIKRLKGHLRDLLRKARGRNLGKVIRELSRVNRGWVAYFRKIEALSILEELDKWMRRKLRAILWRQWKKRHTRFRKLCELGLERNHAKASTNNGRGPWWNAGARHMQVALPNGWFSQQGLVSFLDEHRRLAAS